MSDRWDKMAAADAANRADDEVYELRAEARRLRAQVAALEAERDALRQMATQQASALEDWQLAALAPDGWIAQLRADAERFRWIDEHALAVDMVADPDNNVQVWRDTLSGHPTLGRTLREAIDAAMKETKR